MNVSLNVLLNMKTKPTTMTLKIMKSPFTIKVFVTCCIALSTLAGTTAFAHSNEHPSDMSVHTKPHQHHSPQHHSKHTNADQKPWGIVGNVKKVSRTIEITMGDDFRFKPDSLEIKQHETVRFVIKNTGKILHELVIGTAAENAKHAELMLKFPNMEHDEPYMAHVKAGSTGEILWTFNKAGQFEFACLLGGHYQAGMKGTILVQPASKL